MSAPTYLPYGHALAIKKQSVALFEEYRINTFFENMLGGSGSLNKPVPNPIRVVDDIKTDGGLSVTIDLLSDITGDAVYNRDVLSGKEKPISGYNQELKLGMVRQGADLGSRLDMKATKHDFRGFARQSLARYLSRWQDQYMTFMLTGIAPNQTSATTVPAGTAMANWDALPASTCMTWWAAAADFAGNTIHKPFTGTYLSNGVWTSEVFLPTTHAGTSSAADSSDVASLEWLDFLSYSLMNEATPPLPLTEIKGKPMWLLLVDTKTMNDLRMPFTNVKKLIDIQAYKDNIGPIADRVEFTWGNLMICEYGRIIRAKGPCASDVTLSYNLILGKDAGCVVRANDPETGNPMIWTEEKGDHGDKPRIGGGFLGGFNTTVINSKRVGCRLAPTYFSA